MTRRLAIMMSLMALGCSRPELAATDKAKHQSPSVAAIASDQQPEDSDAGAERLRAMPTSEQSTLVAASTASTPAPNPPERCNLLAVGDSLTDAKSGGGGYLTEARQRCDCEVTNLGKGGAMVNQIRARLLSHWSDTGSRYTHVVIFGGVNDLYSDRTAKRTVAKIETDLEAMYRAARNHGSRVIAITVTPWGGFKRYFAQYRWQNTLELNRWIRECRNRGILDQVIDGERLLSCGNLELLCEPLAKPYRDGLHFGPGGHQRLGAALVEALGLPQCQRLPDDGSAGG